MPLEWSVQKYAHLVVVDGAGVLDPPFVAQYSAAVREAGAIGYRKFFDLRRADIRFSADDFRALGKTLADANAADPGNAPGPVAILIGSRPPPLLLDMAVLLKQHVGSSRRLRIFTQEQEALGWLETESERS